MRGDPILQWRKEGMKVMLTGPLKGAGGAMIEGGDVVMSEEDA